MYRFKERNFVMLAYDCENCKKIYFGGFVNEFNQHFCSKRCYIKYCQKHNYKPNLNNLQKLKTILDS